MKTTLITLASILISGVIFSQSNTSSKEIEYPYTVSSNNQVNTTIPAKTIADIDKEIEAIDIKIQYVKSHPEELEIAVKESWFEQMDEYKKTLEKEKTTLQK